MEGPGEGSGLISEKNEGNPSSVSPAPGETSSVTFQPSTYASSRVEIRLSSAKNYCIPEQGFIDPNLLSPEDARISNSLGSPRLRKKRVTFDNKVTKYRFPFSFFFFKTFFKIEKVIK